MIQRKTALSVSVYGAILILLGVVAYLEKGSLISFAIGGFSGILLLACSFAMFRQIRFGAILSLALTLCLTILFTFRFYATGKEIPAFLALLSTGMLLYQIYEIRKISQ